MLCRILDPADRLGDLSQDLGGRVEPPLKPVGRQLEPCRLLKDTIIDGAAVRLIGRRPQHPVIVAVPVLAVESQIRGNIAAALPRLRDLLVDPFPVIFRGHKKGIPCHRARKFLLPVAQTVRKIFIIKDRLLAPAVQTGEDHHAAGQIGDEITKLLRAVALGFCRKM